MIAERYVRWMAVPFAVLFLLMSSARAESKETVLYSFQSGNNDGAYPAGGVVFDAAGNLYGATTEGGGTCPPSACGTVFELTPGGRQSEPWTESVLYIFKGADFGDGATPAGSVIMDSAGNLYGTTGYGGTGNCVLLGTKVGCGTVYELSPPAKRGQPWTETILYSFPSATQGYLPNGDLVFDSAGNLYGATMFGGGYGTTCDPFYQFCGAVFKLIRPKKKGGKWTEKVLHGFRGGSDGANPNGGLVFDSTGALYGTTYSGGFDCSYNSGMGCGTVFKLTPPTKPGGHWTETVLHRFRMVADGIEPTAGLTQDGDGFYGVTRLGGAGFEEGTVFKLVLRTDGSWKEEVVYSFQGLSDGASPMGKVLLGAKGTLYGTASIGGTGGGTAFRLGRHVGGSWVFSVLYEFQASPDGSFPAGPLVTDASGNIYGTCQEGGNNGQVCTNYGCGTVFRVAP